MLVYHGTTAQGLQNIINGSEEKHVSPWTVCDNDGIMYVYPSDKVAREHGLDLEEDFEEVQQCARQTCFEQAQLQVLCNDETEIFVIEFDIDESLLEDDYSCDNMADSASCFDMKEFDASRIQSIVKHTVNVYHKPFIAVNVIHNHNFNVDALDPELLAAAETISEAGVYLEAVTEFDFEEEF